MKLLKIIGSLLAVLVTLYVGCVASALWVHRARHVKLRTEGVEPVSEDQAITLTREALMRVGESPSLFKPVTFDRVHIYARNTLTPYNGYVIWESTLNPRHVFMVRLEQAGNEVSCDVVLGK